MKEAFQTIIKYYENEKKKGHDIGGRGEAHLAQCRRIIDSYIANHIFKHEGDKEKPLEVDRRGQ